MLYGLGLILIMLGMISADSDSLVIPFALVSIGFMLMWIASRLEGRHGKA